jgi:hypothetical protein
MKSNARIFFLLFFVAFCYEIFSQKAANKSYSTIYIARTQMAGLDANCSIFIENQSPFNLNSNEAVAFRVYSEGEISLGSQCNTGKGNFFCNLKVKRGNDYYVFLDFEAFKEIEAGDVERFKTFISKKEKTLQKEENLDKPIYPSSIPSDFYVGKEFSYATINLVRSKAKYYPFPCSITFPNQQAFGLPIGVIKYKVYSEGEIVIAADYQGMNTIYCTINVKRGNEYYVNLKKKDFKIVPFGEIQKEVAKAKVVINKEENIDFPINKSSLENNRKKEGQGTCFLISSAGYFITNYHCVEGAKEINVKGVDGDFTTRYGAMLIASDPSNDLALLRINNKNVKFADVPFGFRSSGVEQAEKVYALGFPNASAMGEEVKITEGIISSKSGVQGDISKFQISAAVNPGNSGGPLIDESGNLIGVIYAKSTVAESAGYAIKASYLEAFLKTIDGFIFPTFISTLGDKAFTEKIKVLKGYIFIVETK